MTKKKPKVWSGYMDGYLRKNLAQAKKVVLKDWDMVFCVDGYEGTGKSVLAQQCAMEVDETFNLSRIVFTPDEFMKVINKCEKYQAVIYDEAFTGMSSRAAMSEVNRVLMSVLAEIRQKNLFVFLVLPCFFELDKYAAIWRARALLHVYTTGDFQRGHFSFYNQDKKKALYVLGKKFYSYRRPAPNFFGRFTAGYVVDEKEYRQKKLDALKGREDKKGKKETATSIRKNAFITVLSTELKKRTGISNKDIAEMIGVNPTYISEILNRGDSPFRMPPKQGVPEESTKLKLELKNNITRRSEEEESISGLI